MKILQLQFILTILFLLFTWSFCQKEIKKLSSFQQLGQYHCEVFPIDMLYRLSVGRLSEKYGIKYAEIDCYIRQFVGRDGERMIFQEEDSYENSEDQQQNQEKEEDEVQINQVDEIVVEYSKGINNCLPSDVDAVNGVYAIWRFYRYVIQHDFAYEWMRAKIRSGFGYQAERPDSYMDGEHLKPRLRLDKLFSNQFYSYIDRMMFQNFLYPLMSVIRENIVIGLSKQHTFNERSILIQFLKSKNYFDETFIPIQIVHKNQQIFSYTLPGIPLLLGGSTLNIAWAFTGVLVDRTNIQQIETVGNKFYHQQSELWIKLRPINISIPTLQNQSPYFCTYIDSDYGTLYEKHNNTGKIQEYIVRWHEDQLYVRNIFSHLLQFIHNHGVIGSNRLQFPFASLAFVNQTSVYNYICPQEHPSYFIYADFVGSPNKLPTRLISYSRKGYMVMINRHLTTTNLTNLIEKEMTSQRQQDYIATIRKVIKNKHEVTLEKLYSEIKETNPVSLIRKEKEMLIYIYRKAKYVFYPNDSLRKQIDQLIAMLQKWDQNTNSDQKHIFTLWQYFYRKFSFNNAAWQPLAKDIIRYKVLTDSYWINQLILWKVGTSYGECESHEWESVKDALEGTGHNCTCFYNIMRAINKTKQFFWDGQKLDMSKAKSYLTKDVLNLEMQKLAGTDIQESLQKHFSKNIGFGAEVGSGKIIYQRGFRQIQSYLNLGTKVTKLQDETDLNEL